MTHLHFEFWKGIREMFEALKTSNHTSSNPFELSHVCNEHKYNLSRHDKRFAHQSSISYVHYGESPKALLRG